MIALFRISLAERSPNNQNASNAESIVEDLLALFAEFPPLATLLRWHNSDPYRLFSQKQQLQKTAESYNTLLKSHQRKAIHADLKNFFSRAEDDVSRIFPTSQEITDELLAAAEPLRAQFPFYTTNLNFSHPVCARDTTSLNVILRLFNLRQENLIKIKIGAFLDHESKVFWEVGFVNVAKSTRSIQKLAGLSRRSKGDYFLLQKLVDCTKKFIMRRDHVAGLDLTPAYYHVVQLCRRLGGRTVTDFDWTNWNRHLEEAFLHSIKRLSDAERAGLRSSELEKIHRRYLISWLFHHALLKDATGRTVKWEPPRLVWLNVTDHFS